MLKTLLFASLFLIQNSIGYCCGLPGTFAEELDLSDVAIYGRLVKLAPNEGAAAQTTDINDDPRATFVVDKVLKGRGFVKPGIEFQAIYFGEAKPGTKFLLYGVGLPKPVWSSPIEMTAALEKYLDLVLALPADRGERALKMQPYLLNQDSIVREDAFNEFAAAEYKDLQRVAKRFDLQHIRANLRNLELEESLLGVNYTLLGICGGAEDLPLLEGRLLGTDDLQRKSLDGLVGCYLALKGESGLPLIEQQFVVQYVAKSNLRQLYRVMLALRFHGDEGKCISKEKISPVLRHCLENPQCADFVIPDLARWQDWIVAHRVMELYRDKDGVAPYVRDPAVKYMRQCPLPVAKDYLAEMQNIDPDTFKRAMLFPIKPVGGK